ncbi:CoA pyrophosphatase [Sandaracinobacter neustonicus]|uniref:CoA pyrophosphatase n=1 Tax=Sandaracinobacter neustonicus TaxID=1715348 RepID=A0A501XT29_9SPHN|nr:CoA pyrophosphatase [Sandaracinobacter neustonicus]TPE63740.1 CoA pyrophosphatase [Sandaracinobacter neustonicus]
MPSLIDRVRSGLLNPAGPVLAGDQDFGSFGTTPGGLLVPAAVLVPIVRAPEPRLLLTTRTAHLRNHAGQVAFPGGRIDPGDVGPVEAALREAQEEIGLDPAAVEVIGIDEPYQTGTGYRVQPVVGSIEPDLPFVPNPQEVADLFEVPLDYALDPKNHVLREAMWKGRMRRYYVIEWEGRTIWGATAGMLVNLSARLR